MNKNLIVQDGDVYMYRLWDPVTDQFYRSGTGLYSKNGRTIWATKQGAFAAWEHVKDERLKRQMILKKYRLVEVK